MSPLWRTLVPIVEANVLLESIVYTDEYWPFQALGEKGYKHERVPHAERVYLVSNVHTNTIECFWSLLQRSISGVYHSVSAKYLQDYANEYAFRYNHRDDAQAMFDAVCRRTKRVRSGQHGQYSPVGETVRR